MVLFSHVVVAISCTLLAVELRHVAPTHATGVQVLGKGTWSATPWGLAAQVDLDRFVQFSVSTAPSQYSQFPRHAR
jgi:hypothetical protein